jgi:hypothetical protein
VLGFFVWLHTTYQLSAAATKRELAVKICVACVADKNETKLLALMALLWLLAVAVGCWLLLWLGHKSIPHIKKRSLVQYLPRKVLITRLLC